MWVTVRSDSEVSFGAQALSAWRFVAIELAREFGYGGKTRHMASSADASQPSSARAASISERA